MTLTNLIANWPARTSVRALTTTRTIGQSKPPFHQNNLALHVGDSSVDVMANRKALFQALDLPQEPAWLNQTHSTRCVIVEDETNRDADAAITRTPKVPLAILTADCLPILLCNLDGSEIAAIHAGWRGLVNGIVENTLNRMREQPSHLMAWIGPAICQTCYAVGDEMYQMYMDRYPSTASLFKEIRKQRHADLPSMAEIILKEQGVLQVFQSGKCSYECQNEFYSYRRDGQTGRMATLIWLNE